MLVNDKPKDNSFASEESRRQRDSESYSALKFKIESGEDVSKLTLGDGTTFLIALANQGLTDTVRLLLSVVPEVDIHATNENGDTALDVADNEDIEKMLRDAEKGIFIPVLRDGPQRS